MMPLDRLQWRLLRALDLSEHEAMERHFLALLLVRRQIAASGALHRRVLGLAPALIAQMLPFDKGAPHGHRTRVRERCHKKQLLDLAQGTVTDPHSGGRSLDLLAFIIPCPNTLWTCGLSRLSKEH